MQKFKVTFLPDNKTVEVEKDKTILSAALSAGVYITATCGGDGVCGRCKVRVKKGTVLSLPTGVLTAEEKKKGIHLACQAAVVSDCEVEIPAGSRLDLERLSPDVEKRLTGIAFNAEDVSVVKAAQQAFTYGPLTKKIFLSLPKPTTDDNISDLDRLLRELARHTDTQMIQTGLVNIRMLGELLRDADWSVTVTLGRRNNVTEILLVEAGDTSRRNFGFVFDIGTTTISGQLIDLASGTVLGTKAAYNKQAAFGADVITRIMVAEKDDGLEQLHIAAASGMNEIIATLTGEHSIDLNDVTSILCAGNTTMIHLLLRIDPSHIRRVPYVPTAHFITTMRASEVGMKINPRGLLACVPGISSYVGGDVTSGVLACAQHTQDKLSLLIDIGTNGEVVLGDKEFLIATSASAGPAFEGSGVACGMRGASGAIQKVSIDKDYSVTFETIGNTKPRGICGSGYIDAIAEMLRCGILDKDGKIKSAKHDRIRSGELGKEFVLAFAPETQAHADIVIAEADIDNIKRAKAAIFAACDILCRHMSTQIADVQKIFIAGGFGTSLNIANAVRIGLLPDLPIERFIFVGNSSLSGARAMMVSQEAFDTACEIARKMAYFELSTESSYMDEYMAALFFPHTDLLRFPNIQL